MYQVPREGIYAGWNECLQRATGAYIYIATSDDTMVPNCLEELLCPLRQRPELSIAVCNFQMINETGQPLPDPHWAHREFLGEWLNVPSIRNGKTEFIIMAAFGGTIWTSLANVLFRRNLLAQIGCFRTDLGSNADEEWTLRAALASDIAFIPERLATWRVHNAQATQRNTKTGRILLQCIQSVLQDKNSGIPNRWKEISNWADQLSAVFCENYYHQLGLYRWELRRDPRKFVKGVWNCLYTKPKWIGHQILNGFKDFPEIQRMDYARELMITFGAVWPPKRITRGLW